MNLTTTQMILLSCGAFAAIGVGAYWANRGVRMTIGIYRAAMAAAPNPRRMRLMLLATMTASVALGVTVWFFILQAVVRRLW